VSAEENIFISNAQLLIGVFRAWSNARHFLETSDSLCSSKKYQVAVPLATIAFEECQKAIELLNRFRRHQNMTKDEWNKMKNHKHKLTHVTKEAAEIMEKMTAEDDERVKKQLQESPLLVPEVPKQELIDTMRRRAHIHSQFQNLREQCLYVDWNEIESCWVSFSGLSTDRQNDLAFFMIRETEGQIEYLEYYLESMVNNLRRKGILNGPVPYPNYIEIRTPDKFESVKNFKKSMSKADQVRFNQGILTMQKFIALNSFEDVSFGLLSDAIVKYLKIIQKQDDDKWFRHPLLKALMLALAAAKNGAEDGNYMGTSGDADLAPEGKPVMVIVVIVGKKAGIYKIEKIASIGNEDHAFPSDMIERILRADIILERDAGKEISVPNFVEALSVVGVKAKMIREDELAEAINYVRKLAIEGYLANIPQEEIEEIKNKNREKWDEMMPETRSMVVSVYGSMKYPDYRMFFSPTKLVRKFQARLVIMEILQSKYLHTA